MRTRTLTALLAGALSVACTNQAATSSDGTTATLVRAAAAQKPASSLPASALADAVTQNNAFGLALYQGLATTAGTGNFLTSPVSASLALTMTYAGAANQTATEMASALQIPSTTASIFDDQNALSQALVSRAAAALAADTIGSENPAPSPDNYILQVVNSVWGQEGVSWAPPFLGTLATSYGTGVYVEDFANDPSGAVSAINDWVKTETSGKIYPLLSSSDVSVDTRLVLVNAVHLKLPWSGAPFDVRATAPGAFTRSDGTTVTANFMLGSNVDGARYGETNDAQFVSIPLAGDQLSVVLALPKTTIGEVVSNLTPSSWANAFTTVGADAGGLSPGGYAVTLTLPKFTFTTAPFSLKSTLQGMGMKQAFDPAEADLSNMCEPASCGKLFISDVLQVATIGVSEMGVEAAAATAVMAGSVNIAEQSVVVNFNHPFLISIVDQSGAIIFLGQVNDPTDTSSP